MESNSSNEKQAKIKYIHFQTGIAVGLGFVSGVIGLFSVLYGIGELPTKPSLADLANFGTFLQGSAGVFWTLSGLLFVYVAFLGQREQLLRQEIEMEEQRKQFELQQETLLKHNRLSVAPALIVRDSLEMNETGFTFALNLCNHGIGPARIKKFILSLDGKEFIAADQGIKNQVMQLVEARLKNRCKYVVRKSGCPEGGYCILAGQVYLLMEIFFPGVQEPDEKNCVEALKGMRFRVEYESFYGVPDVYETKNHMIQSG